MVKSMEMSKSILNKVSMSSLNSLSRVMSNMIESNLVFLHRLSFLSMRSCLSSYLLGNQCKNLGCNLMRSLSICLC